MVQACLLGGLQSVADEDLPMLTSDFYSKHMLPAKPDGRITRMLLKKEVALTLFWFHMMHA